MRKKITKSAAKPAMTTLPHTAETLIEFYIERQAIIARFGSPDLWDDEHMPPDEEWSNFHDITDAICAMPARTPAELRAKMDCLRYNAEVGKVDAEHWHWIAGLCDDVDGLLKGKGTWQQRHRR